MALCMAVFCALNVVMGMVAVTSGDPWWAAFSFGVAAFIASSLWVSDR